VLVAKRHHLLVRWSHWLNVPILLGLILSGISTYWSSPTYQHKPDPVTGNFDVPADIGIWICAHVPGMTGMRAIYAASLAKRGFMGPSGLFEGPDGLERMFGQPIRADWEDCSLEIVTQTVLKKYCSLIHGQPVLETVLDLKRGNGLVAAANIKERVHYPG
jgi:hypothetical protein